MVMVTCLIDRSSGALKGMFSSDLESDTGNDTPSGTLKLRPPRIALPIGTDRFEVDWAALIEIYPSRN